MNGESAEQRERRLVGEAERRAREDAETASRLKAHDEQFRVNTAAIQAVRAEVATVSGKLDALAADFRQSIAIAETRSKDAEKAAARQVTTRELYISAVGVTCAIIGALAAGGVFT